MDVLRGEKVLVNNKQYLLIPAEGSASQRNTWGEKMKNTSALQTASDRFPCSTFWGTVSLSGNRHCTDVSSSLHCLSEPLRSAESDSSTLTNRKGNLFKCFMCSRIPRLQQSCDYNPQMATCLFVPACCFCGFF